MGRWGDAADKAQGPSDYLKLQDGDEVTVRVLTDPVVQNKTFPSDPDNPRTQFSWIVWEYAAQAPKILSQGAGFAKKLDFISEKWGDEIPMKCDIVIKRTGTNLQTKYDITAVPVGVPLPPDWQVRVGAIDLDRLLPGNIPIAEFVNADNAPRDPSQSFPNAVQAPAVTPARTVVDDEPISLDDIPF